MGNVASTLKTFCVTMVVVAVCAVIWGADQALASEVIRINGSGGPLDMVGLLAAAYGEQHPEVHIETGKPLHFVATTHPSPAVLKFLAFIYSPRGRTIAEKIGVFVVVSGKNGP